MTQRTKRLQARSPWRSKLNPKRRKPRCGDRVQFHIAPWWGTTPGKVYEGTVVDVCYPKSKRYGYYGNLVLKNGKRELGIYYHVDTFVGGQHLDDAMVLDSEIIRIMETKPHAHRKKVSRRRLKVYQRRASVRNRHNQIVTNILQSLGLVRIDLSNPVIEEYPHYSHVGKPLKWGDRTVQIATEVIGAIGDKPEHVMTKRVILDCANGKPVEGMIDLGSHVVNGMPEGPLYISKVVEGDEIKQIEEGQDERAKISGMAQRTPQDDGSARDLP